MTPDQQYTALAAADLVLEILRGTLDTVAPGRRSQLWAAYGVLSDLSRVTP